MSTNCVIGTCPISSVQEIGPETDLVIGIGTADFAGIYHRGSMNITDELNSRNTLRFVLVGRNLILSQFQAGTPVVVSWRGARLFAGSIEERRITVPGTSGTQFIEITCVDYNNVTDRLYVARSFVNQTAGAIVQSIVENELSLENLTLGVVEAGPLVSSIRFNSRKISDAFDELTILGGGVFSWFIDYYRRVNFFARETFSAPWDITPTSFPVLNFTGATSRQDYRNRQIIRAGRDTTDSQLETISGDGETRAFEFGFDMAVQPALRVDIGGGPLAVDPLNIGIRGQQTDKLWYWSLGSNRITQDSTGTKLTTAHSIEATYIGLFPIILTVDDGSEIEARRQIEGGSGIYEHVELDNEIETIEFATEKANGLLARFANIHDSVVYETDKVGLASCQLQSIERAEYGVDDDFLITSVELVDVGLLDRDNPAYNMRATVTGIDGGRFGSWVDFFRRLLAQAQKGVEGDNEQLAGDVTITDTIQFSDVLVVDLVDNVIAHADDEFSVFIVGTAVVGKSEHRTPEKL